MADETSDNPWYRNIEVFPAQIRSHTVHLLVLAVPLVVGVALSLLAERRIYAAIGIAVVAPLAAIIILPLRKSTLFVSDGGLVRTNGTYMVQIPWDALCCQQRISDLWEHRPLIYYRPQRVEAMPPKETISESYVIGGMNSRMHLIVQPTIYGANPADGTFGALLARHRPDLVLTEPAPVTKRWRRCQHQLPLGAIELSRTWRYRIQSAFWPMVFFLAVLIASAAAHERLGVLAAMAGLVLTWFYVGITQARWTLTVSPEGLTEEFVTAAVLHVDWKDVSALRQVRIGISPFRSWVAEFEPRGPRPGAGQADIPPTAAKTLLKRTGGRRINLTEFGLRPDADPLRLFLAAERPDLLRGTG